MPPARGSKIKPLALLVPYVMRYRWRAIGTYQPRLPAQVILRVDAGRAEDYWLGLFPAAQAVPAP